MRVRRGTGRRRAVIRVRQSGSQAVRQRWACVTAGVHRMHVLGHARILGSRGEWTGSRVNANLPCRQLQRNSKLSDFTYRTGTIRSRLAASLTFLRHISLN